jgi:hypothetical protein
MSERAKPFVAYMSEQGVSGRYPKGAQFRLTEGRTANGTYCSVPCVVTPLLPGDPKPGETWVDNTGNEVEVWSAPFAATSGALTRKREEPMVQTDHGIRSVRDLRPKPTLKTYRCPSDAFVRSVFPLTYVEVLAESKDAAVATLAAVLEEVEP